MMKKRFIFILIILVVVALLLIFKPLIFPSSEKEWEFTQESIEETSQGFERIYPEKIKSAHLKNLLFIAPFHIEGAKENQLQENFLIKERLSANTYPVSTLYQYKNRKFELAMYLQDKILIEDEIVAAKNNNFSVHYHVGWTTGVEATQSLKDKQELVQFFNDFQPVIEKEAKFAEKYRIEYLSLGEADHIILTQPFEVTENEMVSIIDDYKESLVPKIREVYNGKVYLQIGNAGEWNFEKLNVSDLDYFGVLIGGMCDFNMFKERVNEVFSKAETLSEKSGIPWLISELWINKRYEECDLTGKRSKYYEYVFEKARASKNLIGIMVDTWNVDELGFETSIKDTKAEQTINNFFENWN